MALLMLLFWPRPIATANKEAIVTVVSSGIYLPGALVLAWSLRSQLRKRDLVAVVPTDTLTQRHLAMLSKVGWRVLEVTTLPLPSTQSGDPRFEDMLDKLYAFDMHQYDIGLIDADAYEQRDLNEAFDLFSLSTTPFAASLAPATREGAFTQDHFAGHFNGGFMLIKPDPKIFQALSTLATNSSYYDVRLAEQSLLNQYFQGQWLGLPGSFNLLYRFRDRPYYWDRLRPTASIIHFAGLEKPWHDCEQDPNLCAGLHPDVRHWRELFRQVYHASHFEIGDFTGEEERIHYTIAKLLDGRLDS